MPNTSGRQPLPDEPAFGTAFRPQLVIDGQRTGLSAALSRPAVRQNGESETVGAARDRQSEEWCGFEVRKPGEGRAELGEGQRSVAWSAGQQPSRFFSVTARSLIALPGFGKSRSSCASATQAFCF